MEAARNLSMHNASKAAGAISIALTGRDGGKIGKIADYSVIAPEEETYRIQEYHLAIYHLICAYVEPEIFSCSGSYKCAEKEDGMIKVIIADDEENVCQLIRGLIDWKSLDMEIQNKYFGGDLYED